jgi:uncharacterized protein YcfL
MRSFLLVALLLTGCSSVPVTRHFPEVPVQLLEKCPPLKTIKTEESVFSEFTKTVVENYTTYYDCSTKQEAWIEWYNTQRKIFEDVK